jgi:flagellar biogenesis protein FliO
MPQHLARFLRILAVALILCFSASFSPARADPAPASSSVATDSSEGFTWQDYQDPAQKRPDDNPVANALGFVVKFGLVIGMIYGVAWLYKRGIIPKGLLSANGLVPGAGRKGLRVLESLPLKGTQSLHLVEVGDRVLVVGSNGRETLVKLSEWKAGESPRSFEATFERVEQGQLEGLDEFSDELESSLRQVIRPDRRSL